MENEEKWIRNANGDILPKEETIVIGETEFLKEINNIKKVREKEENEDMISVYDGVIQELTQIMNEDKKEIKFKYTPMLNYECDNIEQPQKKNGLWLGCNGNEVHDRYADILANHCLSPKKTYNEWLDQRDPVIKKKLALHIFKSSYPKTTLDKINEAKKKLLLESVKINQRKKTKTQ